MPPPIKNPWAQWALDTFERVMRTFLQAFLATLGFDAVNSGSIPTGDRFEFAAFAGAIALGFAFVAKGFGSDKSASFLPENVDPPQP